MVTRALAALSRREATQVPREFKTGFATQFFG